MGKNVGAVAAQAVQKSEKVKTAERTGDQILADVRRNLGARLAVTPDDVRFLLAQYDGLRLGVQTNECGTMTEDASH
jgi:hypothetical protein